MTDWKEAVTRARIERAKAITGWIKLKAPEIVLFAFAAAITVYSFAAIWE